MNSPDLKMRLKAGSPVAAISRSTLQYINDVLKYLTIRNGRLHVSGNRWVIECGGVAGVDYAFKVYLKADGENSDVMVSTGYKCVVDEEWDPVESETDLGPVGTGGIVWIRRTYPTLDEDGEIDEPGAWSDFTYDESPPANDKTGFTFLIASIDGDSNVKQLHFGNISVMDIVDCV